MADTKQDVCARPWKPGTYRDKKAVVHRRVEESPAPYEPKIRVTEELDVRELLGRDTESDEPVPPEDR